MSSQRKKARITTKTTIDSLPEEVMCMIFDRLRVYDVKSASQTCQRWNNIIFRSNYVSRFKLNIGLRNVEAVSKSQRCYRNVKWTVYDQETLSMWDTIHPKITNNLHSLEITCTQQLSTASTIALISESVPLMTQLRSLAFRSFSDPLDQDITPTLSSISITRFRFISNFKIRVDMPELQMYEGNLSALSTPDQFTQPPALDKLKELIINCNNRYLPEQISIAAAKSIFRRLPNIEKMTLNILVEDAIFDAICEICTTLKELAFDYGMNAKVNVANLNKLKHLRRLRLWAIRFGRETLFTPPVFDWSKLTYIEHIGLRYEVQHALKLPTSVKRLEVCIWSDNEKDVIKTITNSAAHLKELKVEFGDLDGGRMDYDEPIELLKTLSHLEHLEVLIFYQGRFLESSFLRMNAPLLQLHKLRFYDAQLQTLKPVRDILKMPVSSYKFRGLKKMFPKLNKPEFSKCSLCSGSDSEYDSSCPSDSD